MRYLIPSVFLVLFSFNAFAESYDEKKDKLLADTTISEKVKSELKEYFQKHADLYKECKAKREELRSKLSPEAKTAMAKHFKRKHQKVQEATETKVDKK